VISPTCRQSAAMAAGLALLTLAAALGGCAQPQMQVISLNSRDIAPLAADDIVVTMRRGGFSDQEILDLGPDVRNTLASSGAAMIRTRDKVEAIFAVEGNFLHVSTRRRGSFIYDLGKKAFL
jgi:hypothetical protein